MSAFRDITNHLISYAVQFKEVKSAYDLRDQNYEWFDKHNVNGYAKHYLHSACSMAMGIVKSWREIGEARLPHLYRPVLRIDQMLVKEKGRSSNSLKLQVTTKPHQYVILDLQKINHKKFQEWSKNKIGEITITMDAVCLPFQTESLILPMKECKKAPVTGIDTNFEHLDLSNTTGIGLVSRIDLGKITGIQRRMKKKRESIQQAIPTNLQKQHAVLRKYKKREQNRVKDVILREIAPAVSAACKDTIIIREDLVDANKDIMRESMKFNKGTKKEKRFHVRLNNWMHGMLWKRVEEIHPFPVEAVYARGTSSKCPFCGSAVAHPEWNISVCANCGTFDRDALSSISVAMRGQKYLRRAPFPPSVVASLREQSVLGNDGPQKARPRHENRCEAMTGDAPKVWMAERG